MRLHILGICGTFMGSLAQLAIASGHRVSGSDAGVYPPMSDQLIAAGIDLIEGYDPAGIPTDVDMVIIGNAMSRGNPSVEYVLDRGLSYCSGPEWLRHNLLPGRWIAGVAGTHGKTTTSSMLAWILEYAGMSPGYLIGGVPGNFDSSARLGESPFFVIEADEYDTAFFDKRSKFVHYQPRTLVLNNLEFDHADIFPDLSAIETQFHHLVRTVPGCGRILHPADAMAINRVLEKGCWSETQAISALNAKNGLGTSGWGYLASADGREFDLLEEGKLKLSVNWNLTGLHNVSNACMAILAARHMGVQPEVAGEALRAFLPPKRRMELLQDSGDIRLFDDFAHHPTAIHTTLAGARAAMPEGHRLIAVLEPRSNTMKMGIHKEHLLESIACADEALWLAPSGLGWSLEDWVKDENSHVFADQESLLQGIAQRLRTGTTMVFMSNGGFSGIPAQVAALVASRSS